MPISSFARLGASVFTLGLLLAAGPNPALAGPKPAHSMAAPKAAKVIRSSKVSLPKVSLPKVSLPKVPSPKAAKPRNVPAATGSLAKNAADAPSTDAPGVTWTSAEPDELRCGRSRRKLWQPGEGWVVKTVTVCR